HRLEKREDTLDQKQQAQLKKERQLESLQRKLLERREHLEKRTQDLEAAIEEQKQRLLEISSLTREQAEQMLLTRLEQELSGEIATRLQRHEDHLRSRAEEKAREILATAIHRYAAAHTADSTVST